MAYVSVASPQAAFQNDPTLKAFNMRVNTRMMEVPARVLPEPTLAYGSPASFEPPRVRARSL